MSVKFFDSEGVPFVRVREPRSSKIFRMEGSNRVDVSANPGIIDTLLNASEISEERAVELAESLVSED